MKSRNYFSLIATISILFYLTSCGTSTQTGESQEGEDGAETMQEETTSELTLTKAPASPSFPDASLSLESVDIMEGDSLYQASFDFKVENYELGVQTEDAATRGIANSAKGQHIHLIINNGPYSAHYESEFAKEMAEGSYVVLAFLSRSYHESVKNGNSFVVQQVNVGDAEPMEVDFTAPHMFYSRPKGTYSGEDTEKLMIDFFLLNTTLSPDGNKIKATVNGEEFMIEEWAPYYVEGLPKGEVSVKLELIDNTGTLIPGPFNSVSRTVTLN